MIKIIKTNSLYTNPTLRLTKERDSTRNDLKKIWSLQNNLLHMWTGVYRTEW